MANVNLNMEAKRVRTDARRELQVLNSEELTTLILDTVDSKTLSVMTSSLRVARGRADREAFRVRSAARAAASWALRGLHRVSEKVPGQGILRGAKTFWKQRLGQLNEDIFKTLQGVIGKPEDNRMLMVKTLLYDIKLFCTQCETAYKKPSEVSLLSMEIQEPFNLPEFLKVALGCPCGYQGIYKFNPNPLIVT